MWILYVASTLWNQEGNARYSARSAPKRLQLLFLFFFSFHFFFSFKFKYHSFSWNIYVLDKRHIQSINTEFAWKIVASLVSHFLRWTTVPKFSRCFYDVIYPEKKVFQWLLSGQKMRSSSMMKWETKDDNAPHRPMHYTRKDQIVATVYNAKSKATEHA